jgi:predicted  nucleic acid-binding Zn-ribbon protein
VTDSAQQPLLTLGDKQYAIDSLSDQAKEMVQGLQVAEAQLRLTQDQLNVMTVARQSMLNQLQEELKDVQPVSG